MYVQGPEAFFDDIDNFNVNINGDELELYLAAPPDGHCGDPIAHWSALQAGGSQLARLALDILSIPGELHFFIIARVIYLI